MAKNGTMNCNISFVDLKLFTKRYWGSYNICDIPSLDLSSLYGRGKEKVSVIARDISITSDHVIYLFENGV